VYLQIFFIDWTTLKSKIINNFKIFHMMCIRCVMKVASTFKICITYIVTLIKLVKLINLVFGSRLVSSATMHLVGIDIYCILSKLRVGCCMLLCSEMQLLFFYICFVC
jgi:hypothetical protein